MNKKWLPWWLLFMVAPGPWTVQPDPFFHRWFDYGFGLLFGWLSFKLLSWIERHYYFTNDAGVK